MTNYAGINYAGHTNANLDTESGIRYGVISIHAVDWWHDESEPFDGDPHCPKCGNDAIDLERYNADYLDELINDYDMADYEINDFCCHECKYIFGSESAYPESPLSWFVDNDEISAEQQGDDTDIFIMKSKYFTYAQFCSPCAPGAVHLENPLNDPIDDNRGYCFGHDWFESGNAPYPVYDVESGRRVAADGSLC